MSVRDVTLKNLLSSSSNAGVLRNAEYTFIDIEHRPGVVEPDRVVSMGQMIEAK